MFIKRLAFLTALLAIPATPAMAGDGHGWRGERKVVRHVRGSDFRVVSYEERRWRSRHGKRRGYRHGSRRHGPPRWARARHFRHYKHRRPHHVSRVTVRETVVIGAAPAPAYFDPGPNCGGGAAAGTVLGGLTGAAIGSGIGKGDGRTAAILTGAVLGAVIGNGIGQNADRADMRCNGAYSVVPAVLPNQAQAVPPMPAIPPIPVEAAPLDGSPQPVVTAPAPQTNGRYCREYQSTATINGQPQPVYGTACLKPDGSWEIVS